MNAGKHVYVEKPMGLTFTDCEEILQLADAKNLKLFVAHYRRGLPYFDKVKSLLPQIGKLLHFRMELFQAPKPEDSAEMLPWRLQAQQSGGGYFYDLAPHGLDIIQFLLDESIDKANGFASNRAGLYAVEDTVVATFSTTSGISGTADWCFVTAKGSEKDRLTFVGTLGEVSCSVFKFSPIHFVYDGRIETYEVENPVHIQEPFIQSVLNELRGNGKALCTGVEALPTAWAMDKIIG